MRKKSGIPKLPSRREYRAQMYAYMLSDMIDKDVTSITRDLSEGGQVRYFQEVHVGKRVIVWQKLEYGSVVDVEVYPEPKNILERMKAYKED